ncbi:MAG: SBBP repeat-containing protein [Patescibacteria group bacterium]
MNLKTFKKCFFILVFALIFFSSRPALAEDVAVDWAKKIGGTGDDIGYSIILDSLGNVYTTGVFYGTVDFDPGAGVSNLVSAGNYDIFISKLDSNGNFVWAKKMGGTSYDAGHSIVLDSSGNVYTTGVFYGTVDFDPGAGVSNLVSGGADSIFISKLNTDGTFAWAKNMGGGIYGGRGNSVTVDSLGNIYATGFFQGTVDFDPGAGVFNLTSTNDSSDFIVKLYANGTFAWAKKIGGSTAGHYNQGKSITVDPSGNTYITGENGSDIFISKLDINGNSLWYKKIGKSFVVDGGASIVLDSSGNVYTTGYFSGTVDFDPGTGVSSLMNGGTFVLKLDSNGVFVWAKKIVSTNSNQGNSVTVDSLGNIYATGYFSGTGDFDPGSGVYNLTSNGGNDVFISKLDSSGNFIWSKNIGVNNNDHGYSITVDSLGNLYTTGYFSGTVDFDPGVGVSNLVSAGLSDAYILKIRKIDLAMVSSTVNNISTSSAILNGDILSIGESNPNVRGFNWGTSTSTFATTTENGTFSEGTYSYNLSNLVPGTIYYYRAYATDNMGTSYSEWTSFTTNRVLELNSIVGGLNRDSAILNGDILSIGESNPNVRGFNWGTSTSTFATTTENGTFSEGTYSYNLSNLVPGTIYYYRAYATDNMGTSYSEWKSFNSFSVEALILNSIDEHTAILRGDILGIGSIVLTTRGFNWGISTSTFATTTENGTFGAGTFSYELTDLEIDTIYYYRAYATSNNEDTVYGDWTVFKTKSPNYEQNFVWAKKIGGNGGDNGRLITVDSLDNVYITGSFSDTVDFNPGSGVYNLVSAGNEDIFISKLNADGTFAWAKKMGSTSDDHGYSITVDSFGNIYTTGSFRGTVDFDPGEGTHNLVSSGESDIFISKLDSNGDFIWVKQIGGISGQAGKSITIDSLGNIYTTGYFDYIADFDPGVGAYNLVSTGSADIFISKLDNNGDFVWAKKIGSTSNDHGYSITVDSLGNVYTAGYFSGTGDFDPGEEVYNLTSASDDIFISKLDSNGNFVWAKKMGGTSDDRGNSITVDSLGNIYTTGYFRGVGDFDPGEEVYNLTSASDDIFISKLDSNGNFVWAKKMGGTGYDTGHSITVDFSGNVYTTGSFSSTVDFDPGSGVYNLVSAGNVDIFISKLNADGAFAWAKSIGATSNDYGESVTVDSLSNVYVTGYFPGTVDFDTGYGVSNLVSDGNMDIFIIKFKSEKIITDEVSNLESSSATINGNIEYVDVFDPTVRGFNWGASINNYATTTESSPFSDSNYSYDLSGLTSGTVYYYRAYATNNEETAYGQWKILVTSNSDSLSIPLVSSSSVVSLILSPVTNAAAYLLTETDQKPLSNNSRWRSQAPTSHAFSSLKPSHPATWTLSTTTSNAIQKIISAADGKKIFALINNSTISTSSDYGQIWSSVSTEAGTWYDLGASADGLKLYLAGSSGVSKSINGGSTWSSATTGNFRVIDSSSDGSKIVVTGNATDIYMSSDSGATWASSSVAVSDWLAITMTRNGEKIAAGNSEVGNFIWVSTDGGVNYLQKTRPSGTLISGGLKYSSYGTKLVATVNNDGVDSKYFSEDDGNTWTEFKIQDTSINSFIISGEDDKHIIALSGSNGYQSLDGGANWTSFNSTLSGSLVAASNRGSDLIAVSGNNIYTSSFGNNLYAWSKDSSGLVSNYFAKSVTLINVQPIYINTSNSQAIAFSPDMKHAQTTISSVDSVNKISLDLSSVVETVSGSKTVTFAEKLIANISSDIRLEVFSGTTMTANTLAWSEVFSLPQQKAAGSISLKTSDIISIFEIGDPNATLTLNKAVRVTFFGQAGNNVGFINNMGEFRPISNTCSGDSQLDGDALIANGDCKINVGSDLIVWTKHFSEYVVYTGNNPVASPASGSSYSPLVISSCSEVTYDAWQTTCIGGKQFRNVLAKSPNFCSLTAEQRALTERSCGSPTTPEVNEPTKDGQANNYISSIYQYERSLLSKIIDKKLSTKLAGRILLQVETKGQAWYLDKVSLSRYYLADGPAAYQALRKFGLGITNADLNKIPVAPTSVLPSDYIKNTNYSTALTNRLKGRIVLQVENNGEAWYINPTDGYRYYLANGEAAYQIMRQLSLGISNENIRKIDVGDLK